MDDMTSPQQWSQNIVVALWWLAAVLHTPPNPPCWWMGQTMKSVHVKYPSTVFCVLELRSQRSTQGLLPPPWRLLGVWTPPFLSKPEPHFLDRIPTRAQSVTQLQPCWLQSDVHTWSTFIHSLRSTHVQQRPLSHWMLNFAPEFQTKNAWKFPGGLSDPGENIGECHSPESSWRKLIQYV